MSVERGSSVHFFVLVVHCKSGRSFLAVKNGTYLRGGGGGGGSNQVIKIINVNLKIVKSTLSF